VQGSNTDFIAAGSMWDYFGAYSDIVFAYAGHAIYIEMMYEMHTPAHFSDSINLAYPFLLIFYGLVASVGYYYQGDETKGYLIDVIPIGTTKAIASAFMFVHMSICYVLNSQVVCRAIHCRLSSDTVDALSWSVLRQRKKCFQGQVLWLLISSGIMCSAFLIANSISFFESFVELIGSIFSPWFVFGAPATMYIIFNRRKAKLPILVRAIVYFCVLWWLLMMSLGTTSSIINLLHLWHTFASPWTCMNSQETSG